MTRANKLIGSDRARAEGSQELFWYALEGLIGEGRSGRQHVATLAGGARKGS
jgi:hypothetical protein